MSRSFDGNLGILEYNGAVVTAMPISMSCWFYCNSYVDDHALININHGTNSDTDNFGLQTSSDNLIATHGQFFSESFATATSSPSLNTWHHAAGAFISTTSRICLLDGGNKGTNSISVAAPTLTVTNIGARYFIGSTEFYMSGNIAEVGVWNVILSDAEFASLGRGYSPLLVRPSDLVAYWPLIGRHYPEMDLIGGAGISPKSSPYTTPGNAVHPRVITPFTTMTIPVAGEPPPPPTAAPYRRRLIIVS